MSSRTEGQVDEFTRLLAEHTDLTVEELVRSSEEFSLPPISEWKEVEE